MSVITAPPEKAAPPSGQAGISHHPTYALLVISAAVLMLVLDSTIVNIALPDIQRELHFSATGLEWVVNAYMLTFGGLLVLGGRTGDLYGRRMMFIAGIALFTFASLMGGLAQTQEWLIVCRVVQGAGAAIASPTALALVTTNFAQGAERNKAMGFYAAMSGAGAAIGLLAGGILTDIASWRWIFFVNVPIGALVIALAPRVLTEAQRERGKLDLPGAITITGAMTLLVYALTHAATEGWSNSVTIGCFVGSAVLLVAFLAIESHTIDPLVPLRIFKNRNRSGTYAIALCNGAVILAVFFFLSQFLQDTLHWSPIKTGLGFLPVSAGIIIVSIVSSRLIGRVGPRVLLTLGPPTTAVALFWLSFINEDSDYWTHILPPLLVLAVGMGLTFVPMTLTAVARIRSQESGLASGLLNTGSNIGGAIGVAALTTVAITVGKNFATTQGRAIAAQLITGRAAPGTPVDPALLKQQIHNAIYDQATAAGYCAGFRVASLIALGAFVIALVAIRIKKEDVSADAVPLAV